MLERSFLAQICLNYPSFENNKDQFPINLLLYLQIIDKILNYAKKIEKILTHLEICVKKVNFSQICLNYPNFESNRDQFLSVLLFYFQINNNILIYAKKIQKILTTS